MDKLILHIGWPKSGTCSIQAKLVANTEQLARFGFVYPDYERIQNAHHSACGLFINHNDPLIPPPRGDMKALVNYQLADQHKGTHTAILCSEGFCRAESVKDKVDQLTQHLNVQVITCVRDPLVWAKSLMNQILKMRLFNANAIDFYALTEEMTFAISSTRKD